MLIKLYMVLNYYNFIKLHFKFTNMNIIIYNFILFFNHGVIQNLIENYFMNIYYFL